MNPSPRAKAGISTPHNQVLTRETTVPNSVEIPTPKTGRTSSLQDGNAGESQGGSPERTNWIVCFSAFLNSILCN